MMQVNFLMHVTFFTTSLFMDIPLSWCGSIFWCKSPFFLPRHYSWAYPCRDASQFSDPSQRVFVYYVIIHGCTHIVMRVNFLMQVNWFFTTSPFMDIPISWCGSIFWCKSTGFCLLRHHSWMYTYRDASRFSDASQLIFLLRHHSWITHIVMQVNFLMQVNCFFTTSLWPKAYLLCSNFKPQTNCSKLRSYEWRDNRQIVLMFCY